MNILKKTRLIMGGIILLCAVMLAGCDDDDDNGPRISSISNVDPSYGFMINSTDYHLTIDINEVEKFEINLDPGMVIGLRLDENRSYTMHVVVLNSRGRVVSEYNNSFFIDNIALDNQLSDFVCSWYVEFSPDSSEYGFTNNFGT
jgi:hypothetical protein